MKAAGDQSGEERAVWFRGWRALVVTYILAVVAFAVGMWSLRHFFTWIRNWGH